jgi:hypothetical protein
MQGAAGGSGGPCCLAHLATKPRVEPSSRGRSNLITPTPDTNGCPGGAAALSSAATTASGGSISGSASWLPDAPEGARRTRRTMWPDGAAQRSRQRQAVQAPTLFRSRKVQDVHTLSVQSPVEITTTSTVEAVQRKAALHQSRCPQSRVQ